MDVSFFNYQFTFARSSWERHDWLSYWLRIDRKDPYWTPPPYRQVKAALSPAGNPHLARLEPAFLFARAMARPRGKLLIGSPEGLNHGPAYANETVEGPVAAVLSLADPRQEDGTAYLSLLKCANDLETLERMLEKLIIALPDRGSFRWIGPTGLSPHLGSGLLVDGWDEPPPLYAPYNPPYLPEIVSSVMDPLVTSRLLTYDLSAPDQEAIPQNAGPDDLHLRPLELAELSRALLPLLQAACQNSAGFPLPDALEAEFLIRWISY